MKSIQEKLFEDDSEVLTFDFDFQSPFVVFVDFMCKTKESSTYLMVSVDSSRGTS